MIAVFSDTHSASGHELEGEALAAAREAEVVIHAGDFNSQAALAAWKEVCPRLVAVYGNTDPTGVREALAEYRLLEHDGVRFAVVHRRQGGETGLALFGRAHGADVVVSGHTHRPAVVETDDVLLLNPGSHAQPRGNRPGFATLERTETGIDGRLSEPDGTVIETFTWALE
ncbi:metallophosphoesterase [Natronobiforma cellulositropha]|uniref:metallophosphoesterase n=1 Tax=Natronobiforma cellulositropha TaxID=1679076 RepID=UPI0021D5A0D6|nr:metallophosphoesterase [Natronobiforma cellulositropha]